MVLFLGFVYCWFLDGVYSDVWVVEEKLTFSLLIK